MRPNRLLINTGNLAPGGIAANMLSRRWEVIPLIRARRWYRWIEHCWVPILTIPPGYLWRIGRKNLQYNFWLRVQTDPHTFSSNATLRGRAAVGMGIPMGIPMGMGMVWVWGLWWIPVGSVGNLWGFLNGWSLDLTRQKNSSSAELNRSATLGTS